MSNYALITGASSGLGKDFAYIHAEQGGNIVLIARRKDKLQEIAQDIQEKYKTQVHIIEKDLTKDQACQEIYDELKEKNISVNILINNAGFGMVGAFEESDIDAQISMIELNVIALIKLTRLFLPDMKQLEKSYILQVSSTASLLPGPNQAVYFASKAFVSSFSQALYSELEDTSVSVTTLMPGATNTEFGEVSGMDKTELFQNTASSYDVAKAGYKAMLEGKMSIIAGVKSLQKVLFYLLPFIPKKLLLGIIKKAQTTN